MLTALRLFSVSEYHQVASTVLGYDERVELLEGHIIQMAALNPPHSAVTTRVGEILRSLVGGRALLRVQQPILLSDRSEPQPDLAVVRLDSRDYYDRHPIPEDILLVVEVSDSTLKYDLENKAPVYAAAGILDYWVVDVNQERVCVFRDIKNQVYTQTLELTGAEVIAPLAFPESLIVVEHFFP